MRRRDQPTATIARTKGGDYVVTYPDGRATVADTLADAERAARRHGRAIVIHYLIPHAELPRGSNA